jgi:hypothetical protein
VRIGRIVVGVLATIGGLTIFIVGYLFLIGATLPDLGKPDRFVSAYPAPDGKYKAVKLTVAGGGAISPFCNDAIFVVPITVADEAAERDESSKIYAAACDTFENHEPAPKIEWISKRILQITFSVNSTAPKSSKSDPKKNFCIRRSSCDFLES